MFIYNQYDKAFACAGLGQSVITYDKHILILDKNACWDEVYRTISKNSYTIGFRIVRAEVKNAKDFV